MSIISSTIKIYSDSQGTNLVDTISIVGNTTSGTTNALSAGSEYWACVESTNDEMISSGYSPLYKFYSLPNIQLTGVVNRDSSWFIRPTTTTTDVVNIADYGLEYADNSSFNNSLRVSGNTVNGLDENTTYYYRPWVEDEFGRIYVNNSDSDSVTTLYAVPQIDFVSIYGASASIFSALINITSQSALSSVYAEITTSGVTTTQSLTTQTGQQYIYINNLTENTQYDLVIKAVNGAGTGSSATIQFTTQMATEVMYVEIIPRNLVDNATNHITPQSIASYDPSECQLDNHDVYLFDNPTHSGVEEDSYIGGANDEVNAVFTNADADTTYWLFSNVGYTAGGVSADVWSEGVEIHTYSLLTFGTITTTANSATIVFTVDGNSVNTEIQYSIDGVNWTTIPVTTHTGQTLNVSGLSSNTTYQLRGRAQNQSGYSAYVTDTFTTTSAASVSINSISNVTSDGCVVNLSITQ